MPKSLEPIPIDDSYAGWVYQFSHRLNHSKTMNGAIEFPTPIQNLGFDINNMLAVPLIFMGETLGVLEVVNKLTDDDFTGDDQSLLDNLSLYAAMANRTQRSTKSSKLIDEKLEELENLKSNFVAIASHELRTPLGLIIGHATFLSDIIQDDQFKQQLTVIIRNARRLKDVIEDLSKVDNYQTGNTRVRYEEVDIKKLVLDVTTSFEEAAKAKNISLSINQTGENLIIEAEPAKIKTALGNIIDNAISFTDEGGNVEVVSSRLSGYAKVSVIDNGIGIPAKDLQSVFDRFFQVENHLTRHHEGMGLGLSVSKAMIEAHEGIIWVESIENEGSTFSFLLPLSHR
jgi:signal transduction histidine kinase